MIISEVRMRLLTGLVIASAPKKPKQPTAEEIQLQQINEIERAASVLDWQCPDWKAGGFVHNWRTYGTPQLIDLWGELTDWQKKVIAHALDAAADRERWD